MKNQPEKKILKLSGNMRVIEIDRTTGECVVPEPETQPSQPMKTAYPVKPLSTLAIAYLNGARFVMAGQTYATKPERITATLWAITPKGQLARAI